MPSIMRESRVATSKQQAAKAADPTPGDQVPVMTIYGDPPQLIRLESDHLMYLATKLIETLGQCWVVTPTRCVLATFTAVPQTPTPFLQGPQAAQQPSQSNGQGLSPGICNRCHGRRVTARGDTCPVCNGKGVVMP